MRKGTKYSYKAVWSSEFEDSSEYTDEKYRVNIKPSIESEVFYADKCKLDGDVVPTE